MPDKGGRGDLAGGDEGGNLVGREGALGGAVQGDVVKGGGGGGAEGWGLERGGWSGAEGAETAERAIERTGDLLGRGEAYAELHDLAADVAAAATAAAALGDVGNGLRDAELGELAEVEVVEATVFEDFVLHGRREGQAFDKELSELEAERGEGEIDAVFEGVGDAGQVGLELLEGGFAFSEGLGEVADDDAAEVIAEVVIDHESGGADDLAEEDLRVGDAVGDLAEGADLAEAEAGELQRDGLLGAPLQVEDGARRKEVDLCLEGAGEAVLPALERGKDGQVAGFEGVGAGGRRRRRACPR